MSNRRFILAVALIVLVINAYPLYQLAQTNGHLYYQNAYDESTYLLFDYSRLDSNLSRPAQCFVTWGHQAGLSGGWLNLLLDTLCLVLFPVVFRQVFLELGFKASDGNAMSLMAMLAPSLIGGLNPAVSRLFVEGLKRGWIYWLAVPEAWYLPILRSPEPQLSLILLGTALLGALKSRSYWPLYITAPFLYSYVSVPVLMVVMAHHLRAVWGRKSLGKGAAILASFAAVCFLFWAGERFLLSQDKRELFVANRLPMLSLTGLFTLSAYFILRSRIDPRFHYAALAAAWTPLLIQNQQVLTGLFFHPTNYEQCSGFLCFSLIVALALGEPSRLRSAALALCFVFLALLGKVIFTANDSVNQKLKWTPSLEAALQKDPSLVAVNDVDLSSRLTMVFPREAPTLFAYQQIFPALAPLCFKNYLCAKKEISSRESLGLKFQGVFDRLDKGYRHSGYDFVLIHSGRKTDFAERYDPRAVPGDCSPIRLNYFLIKD